MNHQAPPNIGSHRRRNLRLLPALAFCLGILTLPLAVPLRAQQPLPGMLSSNRFLLVFDISEPMHRQLPAVQNSLRELLDSRLGGQLHYGDTLGVWYFDADVHAGRLPLQLWMPGAEREIQLRLADFLDHQPVGKESRPERVIDVMDDLVRSSDTLTVIMFSTGDSPLQGTPFDKDINAAYQSALSSAGKSHPPIVTVLQARRGKFAKYTVNPLPWPVVIPELPIRVKNPNAAAVVAAAAPRPESSIAPPTAPPANTPPPQAAPPMPVTTAVTEPPPKPAPEQPQPAITPPTLPPPPVAQVQSPKTLPPSTVLPPKPPVQAGPATPPKAPVAIAKPAAASNSVAASAPAKPRITNAPATLADTDGMSDTTRLRLLIATAGTFCFAALALLYLRLRRGHSSEESLITRSLNTRRK